MNRGQGSVGTINVPTYCIIGVPEAKNKEKGSKRVFEK